MRLSATVGEALFSKVLRKNPEGGHVAKHSDIGGGKDKRDASVVRTDGTGNILGFGNLAFAVRLVGKICAAEASSCWKVKRISSAVTDSVRPLQSVFQGEGPGNTVLRREIDKQRMVGTGSVLIDERKLGDRWPALSKAYSPRSAFSILAVVPTVILSTAKEELSPAGDSFTGRAKSISALESKMMTSTDNLCFIIPPLHYFLPWSVTHGQGLNDRCFTSFRSTMHTGI